MKIFQYIKSHLLISVILLLLIILIIILPIYFLVINKSSSKEQEQEQAQVQEQAPTTFIMPTRNQNQLGFITSTTTNHVDDPYIFLDVEAFDTLLSYGKDADNGTVNPSSQIQYKWVYDKTNIYTIEREILNTKNGYSPTELLSLGKTNKPNTYLVNKIISKYDKNNINLTRNIVMQINPMILSTYENYKKLSNTV